MFNIELSLSIFCWNARKFKFSRIFHVEIQSMTPTFNTIRETCELKRQTSDPIKFSPLDPHLSRLSERLPKQHSDPHPIDARATMQSHLLQRLLQRDAGTSALFENLVILISTDDTLIFYINFSTFYARPHH
jgi:hypothetical protein